MLNDTDFAFKKAHRFSANPKTFKQRKQAILAFENEGKITDPAMGHYVHKSFLQPYLDKAQIRFSRNHKKYDLWLKLVKHYAPNQYQAAKANRKQGSGDEMVNDDDDEASIPSRSRQRRPKPTNGLLQSSTTSATRSRSRSKSQSKIPRPRATSVCAPFIQAFDTIVEKYKPSGRHNAHRNGGDVSRDEIYREALKALQLVSNNVATQLAVSLRDALVLDDDNDNKEDEEEKKYDGDTVQQEAHTRSPVSASFQTRSTDNSQLQHRNQKPTTNPNNKNAEKQQLPYNNKQQVIQKSIVQTTLASDSGSETEEYDDGSFDLISDTNHDAKESSLLNNHESQDVPEENAVDTSTDYQDFESEVLRLLELCKRSNRTKLEFTHSLSDIIGRFPELESSEAFDVIARHTAMQALFHALDFIPLRSILEQEIEKILQRRDVFTNEKSTLLRIESLFKDWNISKMDQFGFWKETRTFTMQCPPSIVKQLIDRALSY